MRSRLIQLIFLVLVHSMFGPNAFAWNDAGHQTIARIAWERLSDAERHSISAMLREHPHFDQYLAKSQPADASVEEWAFLRASTWPDYVRPPRNLPRDEIATHPTHRFHRGPWHYVNFAYRAGQTESTLPANPIVGEAVNATHILEQLELSMRTLTDHAFDDPGRETELTAPQNRAVRLCWLFHLIGDLHQPLHTTTLVDEELFPTGAHSDLGGNMVMIRAHIGGPPYKLHAFWDDRLGTDSHLPTVRDLAEVLTHDPHHAPNHLPEFSRNRHFRDWAAEGYEIAKTNVYREGKLEFAKSDDYDRRKVTADAIPVLPVGVEAESNKIARRRVVLAGYRLAERLKQIANRE